MKRAGLLTVILWLAALALAGWTLRQLPLADIGNSLRGLSAVQWIFWAGLNGVVMALSTVRWQRFARMLGDRLALWPLLLNRMAGQTVSFLTPGPQFGGEPLQIFWLCRQHGVPVHRAVLALSLDRFFELWVNFAVLLGGVSLLLLTQLVPAQDWRNTLLLLGLLVLALPLAGVLVLRQPAWVVARLGRVAARWERHPRLQEFGRGVGNHWQALREDLQRAVREERPTLFAGLLLSVLGWVFILGELRALLWFLNVPVATGDFVLLFVGIRLAMLLPLPGGIGTIEAAVLWTFALLDLGAGDALGLIALMRLRDAAILVFGLLSLRAMTRSTAGGGGPGGSGLAREPGRMNLHPDEKQT
jgi:uncharacterized protein (TIRG00374 family)